MAEQPVSPIKPEESVTTREEMDFDDNEQETGTVSPLGHETPVKASQKSPSPKPRVSFQDLPDEIPPTKPPRSVSPMLHGEQTLIEAFPTIDVKVVKAVLMASGGKIEPAFNALLGMSDPDFRTEEPAPPPQPPRPAARTQLSQMEADEQYARQLAEQYNYGGQRSQTRYNQREPASRRPNQQRPPYDEEDREHSFFDDDLPEIGRNIQQGFLETQKKVNSWITNFKKRLDGDADEEEDLYSSSQQNSRQNSAKWAARQNYGPSQSDQLAGIRKSVDAQRRSTEASHYDADPHEFGEAEFDRLELRDDEIPPPQPPRTSSRKPANPDLFKPQPKPPQSGPVDEVDAIERKLSSKDATEVDKQKKWQPLTSVAPNPEDENDPFSLGDDDEEKERSEDIRKEDTERLKDAARQSISADPNAAGAKTLQESERSGSVSTRNKEMDDLLAGKDGKEAKEDKKN